MKIEDYQKAYERYLKDVKDYFDIFRNILYK